MNPVSPVSNSVRSEAAELPGSEGARPCGAAEPLESRPADADGPAGSGTGNPPADPRHHRARQRHDSAQPGRARNAGRRRPQRAVRSGAARGACFAIRDLRHSRQPLRSGLCRARRPAAADRHRLQGRPSPDADHRAHRQHRRPPYRRVEPDGGCAPARRVARECHHSAARDRRPVTLDSAVSHRPARRRRPRRTGEHDPADARIPAARRSPAG